MSRDITHDHGAWLATGATGFDFGSGATQGSFFAFLGEHDLSGFKNIIARTICESSTGVTTFGGTDIIFAPRFGAANYLATQIATSTLHPSLVPNVSEVMVGDVPSAVAVTGNIGAGAESDIPAAMPAYRAIDRYISSNMRMYLKQDTGVFLHASFNGAAAVFRVSVELIGVSK